MKNNEIKHRAIVSTIRYNYFNIVGITETSVRRDTQFNLLLYDLRDRELWVKRSSFVKIDTILTFKSRKFAQV